MGADPRELRYTNGEIKATVLLGMVLGAVLVEVMQAVVHWYFGGPCTGW